MAKTPSSKKGISWALLFQPILFGAILQAMPFVFFMCTFTDSPPSLCGDLTILPNPYTFITFGFDILGPFAIVFDAVWIYSLIHLFLYYVLGVESLPRIARFATVFCAITAVWIVGWSLFNNLYQGSSLQFRHDITQDGQMKTVNEDALKCAMKQGTKPFQKAFAYNRCLDAQVVAAPSDLEALDMCQQFSNYDDMWRCIILVARQWKNMSVCDAYFTKKDPKPCREAVLGYPGLDDPSVDVISYCESVSEDSRFLICAGQADAKRDGKVCDTLYPDYEDDYFERNACRRISGDPDWRKIPLYPDWAEKLWW